MSDNSAPPSYEAAITTPSEVIIVPMYYMYGQNDTMDALQAQRLGIPLGIYQDFSRNIAKSIGAFRKYIFLLDDSGSMNSGGRWDELIENVKLMLHIIGHFTTVDIYFLNRRGRQNIRSWVEIEACFASRPCGATPMVSSLKTVYRSTHYSETVLCVFTDGDPSDGKVADVMNMVRTQNSATGWGTTFVMCTTEDHVVSQYNAYDTDAPRGCFECIFGIRSIGIMNFDVVDDYESERQEVLAKRGADFHFDKTTYVAKLALGSIDPRYDDMDESDKVNPANIYGQS
jgi:hypothetical protein